MQTTAADIHAATVLFHEPHPGAVWVTVNRVVKHNALAAPSWLNSSPQCALLARAAMCATSL